MAESAARSIARARARQQPSMHCIRGIDASADSIEEDSVPERTTALPLINLFTARKNTEQVRRNGREKGERSGGELQTKRAPLRHLAALFGAVWLGATRLALSRNRIAVQAISSSAT